MKKFFSLILILSLLIIPSISLFSMDSKDAQTFLKSLPLKEVGKIYIYQPGARWDDSIFSWSPGANVVIGEKSLTISSAKGWNMVIDYEAISFMVISPKEDGYVLRIFLR